MEEGEKIELKNEELQEVMSSVPHWILRWGIFMFCAITICVLVGSSVIKYPDVIETSINLTSEIPAVGVLSKSTGKIKRILVKDNQWVKINDYLAVIDNIANVEDVTCLKKYIETFDLDTTTVLPLRGMSLGDIQFSYMAFYMALSDYIEFRNLKYFDTKIRLSENRMQKYNELFEKLKKQSRIAEKQLKISISQFHRDSILNDKGALTKEELEQSYSKYLQGCLSFENMDNSIDNMQLQISILKENQVDTRHQYIDQCSSLRSKLNACHLQLLNDIKTWENNYVIISPIEGKITFTKYWAINQNVTSGEEVFNIVPSFSGTYVGKALLPIIRSGKVSNGQDVNIRFDNFPDNEFGVIKGKVKNVSLVPVLDKEKYYYIVEISLPQGLRTSYHKELPFLPEMKGEADIITENISMFERVFSPLRYLLKEEIDSQ